MKGIYHNSNSKKKGLTQGEAAELIGVTQPAYQRYEAGTRTPSFPVVKEMAHAFNTSVEYLTGKSLQTDPDYVHMFVRIPPKYSVSETMGYLKGKSSLMIFERHANLKYKYGNRHFWCRGYYVDTVGKNAKKIEEYIRNQLQEDLEYDQMSLKEYIDPFTGEPVIKGK